MSSRPLCLFLPIVLLAPRALNAQLSAQTEQQVGLVQLRASDPTLTGAGMIVAQPEAPLTTGGEDFEAGPTATGQPASKFTYISPTGSVTGTPPPNAAGTESTHANAVGENFYGNVNSPAEGMAPGIAGVLNYDANYFYNNVVASSTSIGAEVVNQSFTFGSQNALVDATYDSYAVAHKTLFVSAVSGSSTPASPGTNYNGVSVGIYIAGATPIQGPAGDGRSKPEIVAPANQTSFATPIVSGAAAILEQAGLRGDGGTGTPTAATDPRTLKALLLNGAGKPSDWTHTSTAPLDPRYGSGVLNVYNSDMNLKAGEHGPSTSQAGAVTAQSGGTAAPANNWNLHTITNSNLQDESDHYVFTLSAATAPTFNFTSTLTWYSHATVLGNTSTETINRMVLDLFNTSTNTLVATSNSTIDNVQQIYAQGLAPGTYDLAVVKPESGAITQSETYALAMTTAVPEPSTFLGGLSALAAAAYFRRRRR